jgi:hypothetical protein
MSRFDRSVDCAPPPVAIFNRNLCGPLIFRSSFHFVWSPPPSVFAAPFARLSHPLSCWPIVCSDLDTPSHHPLPVPSWSRCHPSANLPNVDCPCAVLFLECLSKLRELGIPYARPACVQPQMYRVWGSCVFQFNVCSSFEVCIVFGLPWGVVFVEV